MTKQHHLMKEIALAMKAKDFARAVQLYEEDDKGDNYYEVHVYAGKSYFELKQHAKSRECYVKAARIDSEREQAHKGIVEVGFDGDDDDVKFVEEEVIPSVTFLLQKASETEDVEKQKQYLGKLGDGYARCGEHLYLEAAKAYRDLDDLMLKENDASSVGGAAAACSIKAAKCAVLFTEGKAKLSASKAVADAKSKTIVSRKDEIRIAKEASIECFCESGCIETIPFLDGYFRTKAKPKKGDDKVETSSDDVKDIEKFAIKLARARLDCGAKNVEENGKKDALKFADAMLHDFMSSKSSESVVVDETNVLALALDVVAFTGEYLGDEEEGWNDDSSSEESPLETAIKEYVKDADVENPLWVLFTAWTANQNHSRGSFHRSCLGNDLECHHEGTRVELGSRDAKMDKEVYRLFDAMEHSIDADGESDEVLSSTSYSTLQLAMVSMLLAESRAYLGDALGALDVAGRDAVCSVLGLAKTQKRAQLLLAESHAKLGRPFDYDAIVKASPARGCRIRAYYIAITSVARDAKAQKLKWLRSVRI